MKWAISEGRLLVEPVSRAYFQPRWRNTSASISRCRTKEEKIRLFKETFVEINSKDKQKIRTELDNYNDYTKKIEEVQRKPDKTELETLKREKQEFLKKCLKQYINEYILRQDYLIQQYNQIAKENGMKTFDVAGDEEQRS